jgi:hypothetical protein
MVEKRTCKPLGEEEYHEKALRWAWINARKRKGHLRDFKSASPPKNPPSPAAPVPDESRHSIRLAASSMNNHNGVSTRLE